MGLGLATLGQAQDFSALSSQRCKRIAWQKEAFRLDTLTVYPASIRVVPPSLTFSYDVATNALTLENNGSPPPDSVTLCYRVLPYRFDRTTAKRTQVATDSGTFVFALPNRQEEGSFDGLERDGIFNATGIEQLTEATEIERNGSLTRGVSFGTAQDVFVNSALNLQLSGQLTPEISIEAALSDQQVPYQPEGNTQQLQEFDRVFIRLKHKKGALNAGDIVFQNPESEFLRYYKNVQGAQFDLQLGDTAALSSQTRMGVAVAKGQFFSQNITPLEGVAGPYRLTGPRNERFIVVMANSEQVFLDGQRLERGYTQDYVIDYNTAEITFTNRIVITQFSRIRVDFEYAVQNYSRTILQADQHFSHKKWSASVHLYQEKDNRNNPLLFSLTDSDKQLLASVGDSLDDAVAETAVPIEEFSPNQVLYTQKDTVVGGAVFSIFVRANPGDSPLFQVSFSEVTQGGGNYIAAQPDANGRVFEWVAPDASPTQPRFAPLRVIPAPNKRSMWTGRFRYNLTQHLHLFSELAFSDHDANLFSEKDQADNQGFAGKVGVVLREKPLKKWNQSTWSSAITYEYDAPNFRFIDRFRYVEFDRDWSVSDTFPATDQILQGSFQLQKDAQNFLRYNATWRHRENATKGVQQQLHFAKKTTWARLSTQAFLLNAETPTLRTEWIRLFTDIAYPGKWIEPGYRYQLDRNRVFDPASDSVVRSAMNFEAHQWYVHSADSLPVQFKASYEYREDQSPVAGTLQAFTTAQTANLTVQHQTKGSRLQAFFTYRTLRQQQMEGTPVEETITGRLDWQATFLKRAVQSELTFVSNSGRELRREFVFLAVDPGTGTHTWRDENEDGIQQLGEFYEAINPDERNFAKFFTPTNEYTPAFSTQINHRLQLQAPEHWQQQNGVKKFIRRWNYSSSLQYQQRSTRAELKYRLLPFLYAIGDEDLLGGNIAWRSELFFNRRSARFGMEFRTLYNQRRQLLTNGFEENSQWNHTFALRITSRKKLTLRVETGVDRAESIAALLNNRNLDIQTWSVSPQLTWLASGKFRLTALIQHKTKEDHQGEPTDNTASLTTFSIQSRWNQGVQSLLSGNVSFTQANFEGEVNSARGYALLEALQPGRNLQWQVNWSQRLKGGLQLTFSYTGRRPEGAPIIHIGRMQATALF